MLTALILGGTHAGVTYICQMCAEIPDLVVIRTLEKLPKVHNLRRILSSFSPQLVLLEVCEDESWRELADGMLDFHPEIPLIAFGVNAPEGDTAAAAGLGLRVLEAPFPGEQFQSAIFRSLDRNAKGRGRLIAFLPAKAGSGATTIALAGAALVAQRLGKRVLFLECDIESGPVALYLDIRPAHSILEVLGDEQLLDRPLSELAMHSAGIDVLPSIGARMQRLSAWSCQRLLSRARGMYDLVICDLPDFMDEAFEPVVRSSDQVVIVSTASAPARFLAERRLAALSQLGVGEANVSLLINRVRPREPGLKNIRQVPVSVSIPNRSMLWDASRFDLKSMEDPELQQALLSVAEICAGQKIPMERSHRKLSLASLWSAATLSFSDSKSEGARS